MILELVQRIRGMNGLILLLKRFIINFITLKNLSTTDQGNERIDLAALKVYNQFHHTKKPLVQRISGINGWILLL
jgi:hypothetical protein